MSLNEKRGIEHERERTPCWYLFSRKSENHGEGKKKKNLLKSKPEMLHKYITCSHLLKEEFVTRLIHD